MLCRIKMPEPHVNIMKSMFLVLLIMLFVFPITISMGQTHYFPTESESKECGLDTFRIEKLSKYLRRIQEPNLWELSKNCDKEIYRFLWLGAFSIRLEIDTIKNLAMLFYKAANYGDDYETLRLVENGFFAIGMADLKEFYELLKECDYWNLPLENEIICFDGDIWIMEGVKDGQYHMVVRGCPEYDNPYSILCLLLLKWSKLNVKPIY